MRALIVRAHPLDPSKSRSMTMADAFVEELTAHRPDTVVDDVRLYETAVPEIDLDMMTGWERLRAGEHFSHLTGAQQNKLALFDQYTKQFQAADLVVIANPLWNLSVPTRLKAWIDTISRADQIVVMDGGKIVEQGTHQSLLRQQGFYAALSRLPSADR